MVMEFSTPGIAKICEAAGLDFVLIDMEHGPLEIPEVARMIAWFKAPRSARSCESQHRSITS